MKKTTIGIILAATLLLTGCGQFWNHQVKTLWSNAEGLNYHIVLYANDGHVIKEWIVHTNVDNDTGGHVTFYDNENHLIAISGTYLIEQQ